ncbi:FAD-binding oxidoreductase [Woodsholea maritima]|uniref:FAD-binding oxidoreductase n=1 Tax=Woodsholea maritima TaxID=240237 RepID=UPI00037004A2|nr:FAD-binding oxidoreductase [Woodsholea maritima]
MSTHDTALPAGLAPLLDILPPQAWSREGDEIAPLSADWRGRYRGHSPILFKPSTLDEVKAIVAACHHHKIAITPQGGNTGLVGGSTPQGEVLLSLKRMNQIQAVDPINDSLTCEAGAILETIQNHAAKAHRLFPLSLGSQGSAMIGGLISTNAGGVHVLRYGMMRDLVLGLQAVLPDGSVIDDLSGLRKNNTGYDLKQLLIGAEGTLGVITAATLKLFARPASRAVALLGVATPHNAVDLLARMKELTGGGVCAFELMPWRALELVTQHVPGTRLPFESSHPWCVLMEVTSGEAERAEILMQAGLEDGFERGLIEDGVIAQSQAQMAQFWGLRESIPEGEKAHGKAAKHDISVPVSRMADFLTQVTPKVEAMVPGAQIVAFGHVGDGNAHYNLTRQAPGAEEDFIEACKDATAFIYDQVDHYGGSISAEHGIGILKRQELADRYPERVSVMKAIKATLDPHGIMNPRILL